MKRRLFLATTAMLPPALALEGCSSTTTADITTLADDIMAGVENVASDLAAAVPSLGSVVTTIEGYVADAESLIPTGTNTSGAQSWVDYILDIVNAAAGIVVLSTGDGVILSAIEAAVSSLISALGLTTPASARAATARPWAPMDANHAVYVLGQLKRKPISKPPAPAPAPKPAPAK